MGAHGIAGGNALVFEMTRGSEVRALKCFTHGNRDSLRSRYHALQGRLNGRWPAFMVPFRFLEDIIEIKRGDSQNGAGQVKATRYPALEMAWNRGEQLGDWLRRQIEDRNAEAILAMAHAWAGLVVELAAHGIVHGDLQHGNVMVVDNRPTLVDYDGMYLLNADGSHVPPINEVFEIGMPRYQHPGRTPQTKPSRDVDRFSAWVILLALRATASDLDCLAVVDFDETLLFMEEDLETPDESPVWRRLAANPDPDVVAWSRALRESLDQPLARVPAFACYSPQEFQAVCRPVPPRWEDIAGLACKIPTGELGPRECALRDEARRRMMARADLASALAATPRSFGAIKACYPPELLADWPACADLVAQANEAMRLGEVWARLQALRGDEAAMPEFIEFWCRHRMALQDYREGRELRNAVEPLRIWDMLESARAGGQVRRFMEAVEQLRRLGAAAILCRYEREICAAQEQLGGLAELERLCLRVSEVSDREFATEWQRWRQRLKGADAEPWHRHYQDGQVRLQALDHLGQWVDDILVMSLQEAQRSLQLLPAEYEQDRQRNVRARAERKLVTLELGIALKQNLPRAIQSAWQRAQQYDVTNLKSKWLNVCQRAVEDCARLDALNRLHECKATMAADAFDREWLRIWDEQRLRACQEPEMQGLRREHRSVLERVRRWTLLKHALDNPGHPDPVAIVAAMDEAVLGAYPPVAPHREHVDRLCRAGHRIQALLKALKSNANRAPVPEDFDCIRRYPRCFDKSRRLIERWVQEHMDQVQLRSTSASDTAVSDGIVRLTWHWDQWMPSQYKCFYALSATRWLESPRDGDVHRGEGCAVIDVETYQRNAGLVLALPKDMDTIRVTIWPVVSFAWKDIVGRPFRAGPIAARRRWFGLV